LTQVVARTRRIANLDFDAASAVAQLENDAARQINDQSERRRTPREVPKFGTPTEVVDLQAGR
jgi:hypothetical protein